MDIKAYIIIIIIAAVLLTACPGTPDTAMVEKPEGFAIAEPRFGEIYTAVSPEGIIYSLKTEENYPKKDIDFWSSALKNQFIKNGYQLYKEEELSANGKTGVLFEWLAPYSSKTYVYMTYITVDDETIIIAEAAGEVSLFKEYREAIKESIQTIILDTGKTTE